MKHVLQSHNILALLAKDTGIYKSTNAFIKPIKQDFMKDNSLLPMCRCMIALLSGWSGQGQAIETTRGILGKHMGRSVRQISRYLTEAVNAGYLTYAYTKDRIGRITGLKIYLNFSRIRPKPFKKKIPKSAETLAMPRKADTNGKYIYKRENTASEQRFLDEIDKITQRNHLNLH